MSILAIILISIFLFVLLREVFCWYFKINEKLSVSKKILAELKRINLEGGK